MKLDAYMPLRELAVKLGLKGKNPVEAMRRRCARRGIPTRVVLGTRMVLRVSVDEAMKREESGSQQ